MANVAEIGAESDFAFEHTLPSHKSYLFDKLYCQWLDRTFCDLQLRMGDQAIQVHSCVISAYCPTVASILLTQPQKRDSLTEATKDDARFHSFKSEDSSESLYVSHSAYQEKGEFVHYTVTLDFSCEVMDCVVSALYTGMLKPKAGLLQELLEAAQWLGAEELVTAIKQHGSVETTTCAEPSSSKETTLFGSNDDLNLNSVICTNFAHEKENPACFVHVADVEQVHLESDGQKKVFLTGVHHLNSENIEENCKPGGEAAGVRSRTVEEASLSSLVCTAGEKSLGVLQEAESHQTLQHQPGLGGWDLPEPFVKLCRVETTAHCLRGGVAGKECGCQGSSCTSSCMLARLKRELMELKQNCKTRKVKRPSPGPAKPLVGKVKRKPLKAKMRLGAGKAKTASAETKRKKDSAGDIKGSVIEEVEDCDPMKQELNFLMGNSTHVRCRRCDKKFASLELYHSHMADHPTYRCSECGLEFMHKFHLTRHVRFSHEGAPHLECKLCSSEGSGGNASAFKARTETEFRRHALEVHKVKEPFTCSQEGCSFRASKFERVVRHQQIHSEEKLFVCGKCGQGFAQHNGLVSHQRACYQMQEYLCDLCGQSFNHAQSMKSHRQVVHFGEKRFKCEVCFNSFSDHRNLRRHMRIHDNSFPYACPVCKQKYRHSNSLKAHIASKHADLPPEQLQLPNPQPRNKLGGSSFKRHGKTFAVRELPESNGFYTSEADSRDLAAVQINSREAKGRKNCRLKEGDPVGQCSNKRQQQQSQLYHQQQLQHRQPSGVVGQLLIPAVEHQSGFEAATNDLDKVIDQQVGLGDLRLPELKTASDVVHSDTATHSMSKGSHEEMLNPMKEYTAFLERQTSLYSMYPGIGSNSHLQQTASMSFADSPTPVSAHTTHHSPSHPSHIGGFSPQSSASASAAAKVFSPPPVGPFAVPSLVPFPVGPSSVYQNDMSFLTRRNGGEGGTARPAHQPTHRRGGLQTTSLSVNAWGALAKGGLQVKGGKNRVGLSQSPALPAGIMGYSSSNKTGQCSGVLSSNEHQNQSSASLLFESGVNTSFATATDLQLGHPTPHSKQQQQPNFLVQVEAANFSKTRKNKTPQHYATNQSGTDLEKNLLKGLEPADLVSETAAFYLATAGQSQIRLQTSPSPPGSILSPGQGQTASVSTNKSTSSTSCNGDISHHHTHHHHHHQHQQPQQHQRSHHHHHHLQQQQHSAVPTDLSHSQPPGVLAATPDSFMPMTLSGH